MLIATERYTLATRQGMSKISRSFCNIFETAGKHSTHVHTILGSSQNDFIQQLNTFLEHFLLKTKNLYDSKNHSPY